MAIDQLTETAAPAAEPETQPRVRRRAGRPTPTPSVGTTPPGAAPSVVEDLRLLPVDVIDRNPLNRKCDERSPAFAELCAGLGRAGLIEPIVVRKSPQNHPSCLLFYQLVAGERRWRAAVKLGWKTIPAIVRELTEQQAELAALVENFHRQDLTPIEEGAAVAQQLALGRTVRELAEALGKSPAWVSRRSKLTRLAPATIAAWEKMPGEERWPASMLEELALVPENAQRRLLATKWIRTAKQLRSEINRTYLRRLAQAPWKLDDAALEPKAGACSTCPHRLDESGDPLMLQTPARPGGQCRVPECYARKLAAHAKAAVARAAEKLPAAAIVSEKHYTLGAEARKQVAKVCGKKTVLGCSAFSPCRKDTPGAEPAIVADPAAAGKVIWIVRQGAVPRGARYGRAVPQESAAQVATRKKQVAYVAAARVALAKLARAELLRKIKPRALQFAVAFDSEDWLPDAKRWAALNKMTAAQALAGLGENLNRLWRDSVEVAGPQAGNLADGHAAAQAMVKALGLKLDTEPEPPAKDLKSESAKSKDKTGTEIAKAVRKARGKRPTKTGTKARRHKGTKGKARRGRKVRVGK